MTISTADRSITLELLEDDAVSYAEAARRTGLPYQRVYRIAQQGGIGRRRHENRLKQQADEEQRKAADQERLSRLLAEYHSGQLTARANAAVVVVDALNVKPAIERGDDRALLEALDHLAYLRDHADFLGTPPR